MINEIQKSAGLMPSSGLEGSKGLQPTGGLASHRNRARKNIDDAFDNFMPEGQGGGGGKAGVYPFQVVNLGDDEFGIPATTASYLHRDYLNASGMTITALNTPVEMAEDLHLWIEVAIIGGPTVNTAELKSGTAFPATFVASSGAQTQYNIPVGRVVSGAQPGMPGFDFAIDDDVYHWQQLLREHQIMENYCFSGVPGFKAFPWQGA